MSGFRKFLLQGNLVEVAIAFVIGAAFGTVVTSFVTWFTHQLPNADKVFSGETLVISVLSISGLATF